MKKVFFITNLLLVISYCVFSQNVGIGTNSPASKLHIKGNADASQLTIDANATQSNSHPLIRLRNSAGSDLLHIHADDTTNIFIGFNAAKNYSVTAAIKNNIFIGNYAGFYNTSGYYNTVVGSKALSTNTSGHGNTAYGFQALVNNNNGNYNVALGSSALQRNVSGNYNTAVGVNSLDLTYASDYNTALGFAAGDSYDNGYNNVFLGANVDVNGPGYYNVIAIGQGTVCTGVSQVTIGNGATTSYRAYALWSNISDGRYKKNIKENVHGLDFINKLRPVTYNLDAAGLDAFLHKNVTKNKSENIEAKVIYDKALKEKESVTYSGFVAQEVETSAKELGFDFSGVDAPKDANDVYGLRYAEFVVPLVKAVQEQQKIIESQQQKIDDLEKRLIVLEKSLGN